MNTLPPITVSTTDRDRLFAVLDNFKGDSDQIDYLYDELARANHAAPLQYTLDACGVASATIDLRLKPANG